MQSSSSISFLKENMDLLLLQSLLGLGAPVSVLSMGNQLPCSVTSRGRSEWSENERSFRSQRTVQTHGRGKSTMVETIHNDHLINQEVIEWECDTGILHNQDGMFKCIDFPHKKPFASSISLFSSDCIQHISQKPFLT